MPGFPLRHWSMRIVLLHADTKQEIDADIFESVTYILHESFGEKAEQSMYCPSNLTPQNSNSPNSYYLAFKKPPFRVAEDGWGEFELRIDLKDLSGKPHNVVHDLNFANARYETKQIITFKNPKGSLLEALRNSGPIPGESATNGADTASKKRSSEIGAGGTQKKKKGGDGKAIDMDKLAEGLQKLGEDDLLQVVQMVHDNKSEESWMRNDVERRYNLSSCSAHTLISAVSQRASSTSISTHFLRISSRCSGTSPRRRTPFLQLHSLGSDWRIRNMRKTGYSLCCHEHSIGLFHLMR